MDEDGVVVELVGVVDDGLVLDDPGPGTVGVDDGGVGSTVVLGAVVVVVTGTRTAGTSSVRGAGSGRRYTNRVTTNAAARTSVEVQARPIILPRPDR